MPRPRAATRACFEDTGTRRCGGKFNVFICKRCGVEILENAYRFAVHLSVCKKATDEDRALAAQQLSKSKKHSAANTPRNSVPGDVDLYGRGISNSARSDHDFGDRYGVAHRHSEGNFDMTFRSGPNPTRFSRGSLNELDHVPSTYRPPSHQFPYGHPPVAVGGRSGMAPFDMKKNYIDDPYGGGVESFTTSDLLHRASRKIQEHVSNEIIACGGREAGPGSSGSAAGPSGGGGLNFDDRCRNEYGVNGERKAPPGRSQQPAVDLVGGLYDEVGPSFQDRIMNEYDTNSVNRRHSGGYRGGGPFGVPGGTHPSDLYGDAAGGNRGAKVDRFDRPPSNRLAELPTGHYSEYPDHSGMYGWQFQNQAPPSWWSSEGAGQGGTRRLSASRDGDTLAGSIPGASYAAETSAGPRNPYYFQQGGRPYPVPAGDSNFSAYSMARARYEWDGGPAVHEGGGAGQLQTPYQAYPPHKFDYLNNPAGSVMQSGYSDPASPDQGMH